MFHPRAVFQIKGSEVEPDLMVRAAATSIGKNWELAPIPILVVEVFSPYTRRRDLMQKREFYLENGVAEYWMIDPERRSLTSAAQGKSDVTTESLMTWHPVGASEQLEFMVSQLFD